MKKLIEGKNILITGGVGTIGLSLAKYLQQFKPKVVRLLDNDETRLSEAEDALPKSIYRFFLGDVRDKSRLERAMEGIDMVFHAAALKHVPVCEYNPTEPIKTNILGTQNVIESALDNEVERVLYTSSDKAANPFNVMGASKLVAEKLITAANYFRGKAPTRFCSVRFGNVLGSRGSILPVLESRMRERKPVEVTHKEMTRFVMLEKEALDLMLKSTVRMVGGEIFIFKMPVVSVPDLVEVSVDVLAKKLGLKKEDTRVEYSKPRIGEKLFEELMTESESEHAKEDGEMFVILPQEHPYAGSEVFDAYADLPNTKSTSYASNKISPISKDEIRKLLEKV